MKPPFEWKPVSGQFPILALSRHFLETARRQHIGRNKTRHRVIGMILICPPSTGLPPMVIIRVHKYNAFLEMSPARMGLKGNLALRNASWIVSECDSSQKRYRSSSEESSCGEAIPPTDCWQSESMTLCVLMMQVLIYSAKKPFLRKTVLKNTVRVQSAQRCHFLAHQYRMVFRTAWGRSACPQCGGLK
jgi:hypothetical protein